MFFESHAHYDDALYDEDRGRLLAELKENGVDDVVNIGADIKSSEKSLRLAQKYNFIYAAVGVHPHEAKTLNEDNFSQLEAMCERKKCVAVGEIGLDYHYDNSPRDVQRFWFERQLELAYKINKPVVIHSRDAAEETFEIIRNKSVRRGVIHCYSGALKMAQEYVDMGFYLGIGGVVTFPKTKKLREVVEHIPLTKLLIETDCPYLAPVPHRGERNESKFLHFIAAKIAEIRQTTIENVAELTRISAKELFSV
jgi:TatD DNase family protein